MMETTGLATKEILRTGSPNAAVTWDRLLQLQTDIFLPFELNYYFDSKKWNSSKQILDIGCGNGYYLSKLKSCFPKKLYTGIDLSAELIAIAKSNYANPAMEFICTDLFEFCPQAKYDIVLMRLILQHMIGINAILDRVSQFLAPNGAVIIAEPDTDICENFPETPKFEHFVREINSLNRSRNGNRLRLSRLSSDISTIDGWSVTEDLKMPVTSRGPAANSDIVKMYQFWVDIWEYSGALNMDFQEIREELSDWSQAKECQSHFGFQILQLEQIK